MAGVKLSAKGGDGIINFDVKAKLEEKEHKSQMVVIGFSLFLTTKPVVVKFEIEGTATLAGKDAEIAKMLEVDPETKVPFVFQRIYQTAFTAMYLMSTVMNAPPPPQDLLFPSKQGAPVEGVSVEVDADAAEASDGVTVQADTGSKETS